MKYSLVTVYNEENGKVDGVLIQNYIGTLDEASKFARETEKANSNRIVVAVVGDLCCSTADYSFRKGLKRLDV